MTIANTSGQTLYNLQNGIDYYLPLASLSNGMNFLVAGQQYPWINDNAPPSPSQSVQNLEYTVFDNMIFGKLITPDDVSLMVDYNNWTANTVYSMYDDQNSNLFEEPFFVVSPENGNYYIFKCIDNNQGSPSTFPPLFSYISAEETFYETADGYVWKYMASIPAAQFTTFATTNFVPLIIDPNVIENAVNGGIEAVSISVGGNNYFSFANGQFQGFIVGGNSLVYAIDDSSSLQLTLANTNGTFIAGETVTQGSNTAVVSLYDAPFLQLNQINGQFGLSTITGTSSHANGTAISIATTTSSSNNNFYNNCSIYIQSGTGLGQIRKIVSYQIIGTQRLVTLDLPFVTPPDATSHYLISPRVVFTGDGTGAQAVSLVNTSNYSVSTIKMIDTGVNYSYCNVQVIGNTGLFGVGSNYFGFVLADASGTFANGETVSQGSIATGTVTFANTSVARITVNSGQFNTAYEEFGIGPITGAFTNSEIVSQSNTVYGVLNIINSTYIAISSILGGIFSLEGGPITGNTSNATANLAYASSLIGGTSNTRATILTTSSSAAQARAIISPQGGHGADPQSELGASIVGVSVTFNNNEGNTIPAYGIGGNTQYRNVSILQQPLLANVQLALTSSTGGFQIGETLLQYVSSVSTDSTAIANIGFYHYTVGNYVTLTMSNSSSFAVNNVISQTGANGLVISKSSNNIIVRTDNGVFTNTSTILTSNALVNAVVESISQGFTNTIFGNDGSNNIFSTNTLTSYIQFFVNGVQFPDFTFLIANSTQQSQHANATTIQLYNYTLTNNDIVTVRQYIETDLISNSQYAAAGVVLLANSSVAYLTNVNNLFTVGSTVVGASSLQTANVSAVIGPVNTVNLTTRFIGQYISANTFIPNANCMQWNQLGSVTGFGNVQGVIQGANSTTFVVSVTNLKGTFQSTNGNTSQYLVSSGNTVTFQINSIIEPDLIHYSGDVIYLENIIPITRANTQNEVNKVVLNFS